VPEGRSFRSIDRDERLLHLRHRAGLERILVVFSAATAERRIIFFSSPGGLSGGCSQLHTIRKGTLHMAMSFDPFTELDRFSSAVLSAKSAAKPMPVDLFREGDRYVLTADLPGVDPGSVDVDVDGQLLTIRAQRPAESRSRTSWLVQERPHGTYLRQFSVGEGVDVDKIAATCDDGVLSLVIPITEKAKPRKIEVTTEPRASQRELAVG
jgi:HSP20 family protein